MTAMSVAHYELELIQDASGGVMDTTPIDQLQHPELSSAFMTLQQSHAETSLQNHLLQEGAVFLNDAEHTNNIAPPMHVAMPELPSTVFMDALDGNAQILPAPPAFISDFPAHTDMFALVTPLENSMALELSASPQHSQIPSPSIHGTASSYSAGVTSSLESALDPAGVSVGRSRANTSVSPPAITNSFASMSPPSQKPLGIAFPPSEAIGTKQEASQVVIEKMLKDIVVTASSAEDACRMADAAVAHDKVDELKQRISQVSKMLDLLTVSSPDPAIPPSFLSLPVAPTLSIPETQTMGYQPMTAPLLPPLDMPNQLSISDQSRKRCASELEEHRTVKALKMEPQDDFPLPMPPPPSVPDTLPVYSPNGVSLATAPHSLNITSQSRPPSRPPTPSKAFTNIPFSPIKQQPLAPTFPPYMPPSQAITFSSTLPTPVVGSSPTFPGLHSAWSDTVIPTSTRHHHSLSAGSVNKSMQSLPSVLSGSMESFPAMQLPPQSISNTTTQPTMSTPIGRMSRSGSINGASYPNAFNYGYMETVSEAGHSNWSGMSTRRPSTTSVPAAPPVSASMWYMGPSDKSVLSGSPSTGSDGQSTQPSTTRNSPTDDEDDDEGDSDVNEAKINTRTQPSGDSPTNALSSSDVPQEFREAVDRIFFEFLNRICSDLEAKDSNGDYIHQTLMAKKMQRLDESPDFRPFKFRIQAFTHGFLDELAAHGYPEEKIPMKKIRNYLWRQPYIQRFNEDGKKAKSKGNHIWNIEAKRAGDKQWEFRPFHRKLAGSPPSVAYCGLRWSWTPRIADPQACWSNIPVQYSSPSLPSWLSWENGVLSGIPPPDAQNCQVTANAKFVLEGQEGHLSMTFNITIAPVSTETSNFSRSRRPSLAGEPPRRSTSDSALFQAPQRSKPRTVVESSDTRVIRVLQSVAQRVSEEAAAQFISASSPRQGEIDDLVKQKHVLEQTVDAYDKAISGPSHRQTRRLAVAAQNVVVQAAHSVIADRSIANGLPAQPQESAANAIQHVTVHELTDVTQDAIAIAVQQNGTSSTEVDIIIAATSILKARTPMLDPSNDTDPEESVIPDSRLSINNHLTDNNSSLLVADVL